MRTSLVALVSSCTLTAMQSGCVVSIHLERASLGAKKFPVAHNPIQAVRYE